MNVMTATTTTRRDEIARDHVGQALDRRPGPLGLADHAHDLGQQRLGPDALGPHDQAAGAVDRAADHAGRRALSRPGSARRVIIDSSTALLPSSTTPSTGTFSPGRTRSRSPGTTCSSGTSSS